MSPSAQISFDDECWAMLQVIMVQRKISNRSLMVRILMREAIRFKKIAQLVQNCTLSDDLIALEEEGIKV